MLGLVLASSAEESPSAFYYGSGHFQTCWGHRKDEDFDTYKPKEYLTD